jgi:2-polyprenyl-6-methoxyphenol hydroxylase-like FAD-dependent oxidoreductase
LSLALAKEWCDEYRNHRGGIGGMTLALSLLDAGIGEVEIYESAAARKELGVGINVLPHTTREMTELGLLDDQTRRSPALCESFGLVAIPTREPTLPHRDVPC